MTTKQDVVNTILASHTETTTSEAESYAPANIALCKYWGKRDTELNLPITSSLSMSLGRLGSRCQLRFCDERDRVILNDTELSETDPFVTRASQYLDLFRKDDDRHYHRKPAGRTGPPGREPPGGHRCRPDLPHRDPRGGGEGGDRYRGP